MTTNARRLSHGAARLALGLLLSLAACRQSVPEAPPTLAGLAQQDDVKDAGLWLMSVEHGLHRLDTASPAPTRLVVGVHGHDSKGYEWIHALKTMGEAGAQVHFFRYDYEQCPQPSAEKLDTALDSLLASQPEIEQVQVMGHSYGGLVAMLMASRYEGEAPLTVDIIASPLAAVGPLGEGCNYDGPTPPAEGVTLRQWRTQKELDGAFERLPFDPQDVELPGEVTVLPDTYRGHRLGHNWSISWVADHLGGGAAP